ncbi:hypothetical protein [Altererythrobacter lauratis]|uniref:Uncharacterized protein n=1 Tax=Alteraurantiacibacter lauratis TaxID=2054627 RepID=A0ABV7EAF0_9SPHN
MGAATGKPVTGAAECVCRGKKAQGLLLRESRGSRVAILRPPADHVALAFHHDINLYSLPKLHEMLFGSVPKRNVRAIAGLAFGESHGNLIARLGKFPFNRA